MKLIHQLRAMNSNAAKQVMLKGISELEWKTFVYALHPDSMYHMTMEETGSELGEPTEQMFTLLNQILDGDLRGDQAKAAVRSFANQNGELILLVVNKKLRCGVTTTTFNKVHPGSIPQFMVQLAKEVPLVNLRFPVLAQLKYDGVRLIAKIRNRECTFWTRNGKQVNLPDLKKEIESFPFDNYILDGEIVLSHGLQVDRTSISGMINSAMHGGHVIETAMVFHVFDTMPLSSFEACDNPTPYADRFGHLQFIWDKTESTKVQIAITNEVFNHESLTALYEAALGQGYEGLVLKYPSHRYTFRRSKDWIKIKEVKTADLKCVGVQAGTGKYTDMIGALICQGEVEGKKINVNVGSGLTDIQRSMDDIHYIGETIEVKYNTLIQDSVRGGWSLFLPRFVEIRIDK